jgi:nitroreductase
VTDVLSSLSEHIERVLDAPHLAPSHDNLQPWRFVVEGETISFHVDHERDRSPANAGGRIARIALGAALECALPPCRWDGSDGPHPRATRGRARHGLDLRPEAHPRARQRARPSHHQPASLRRTLDKLGAHARRLVESASAVCIVATPGTDAMSDVLVGRTMQRVARAHPPWLRRPLDERDSHHRSAPRRADRSAVRRSDARALVASFRAAFPGVDRASRIAFLMRVGQSPPPTTRVRRLPLGDSVAAGGAPSELR